MNLLLQITDVTPKINMDKILTFQPVLNPSLMKQEFY